jgi:predicted alpha/beta hydrolase family esterase
VRGAYLVSGFLGVLGQPEFDTVNDSFFKDPFNWDKVREKVGVARVYNGSDDPYVPLSKGVELAHLLGTKLTIVEGGGHINAAAGFRTFPRLLDDILQTLS